MLERFGLGSSGSGVSWAKKAPKGGKNRCVCVCVFWQKCDIAGNVFLFLRVVGSECLRMGPEHYPSDALSVGKGYGENGTKKR